MLFREILKGMNKGLGFLFAFGLCVFAVYAAGSHLPSDIEEGEFSGNYSINGSVGVGTQYDSNYSLKLNGSSGGIYSQDLFLGDDLVTGNDSFLTLNSLDISNDSIIVNGGMDSSNRDNIAFDIGGRTNSYNFWGHTYDNVDVPSEERLPLEGPDGEELSNWSGIVSISDDHRDAVSSIYFLNYNSDAGKLEFSELSYINADRNERKYRMIESGGKPYVEMDSSDVRHTSWTESSHQIRIDFKGVKRR